MKYKDLLVGDWFKYMGVYYIKSQKYTDPKFINVSLCDGNVINIDENAEVEFASYFFAIEQQRIEEIWLLRPLVEWFKMKDVFICA